jgi:predicted nucleic acid-binding protein
VDDAVVDASVLVDLLAGTSLAEAAAASLDGVVMHGPAHLDVEVLSALGRLQRADVLSASRVAGCIEALTSSPITRHELPELLAGAWKRRRSLRLTDAVYVELAGRLGVPLLTTDARLARAARVAHLIRP